MRSLLHKRKSPPLEEEKGEARKKTPSIPLLRGRMPSGSVFIADARNH
jgi:hypothetical protein